MRDAVSNTDWKSNSYSYSYSYANDDCNTKHNTKPDPNRNTYSHTRFNSATPSDATPATDSEASVRQEQDMKRSADESNKCVTFR